MEVLSVQNQYQGQFGVIGSSKAKDWTSPLTPPPPPPPLSANNSTTVSNNTTAAHNQRNQLQLRNSGDSGQEKENSVQLLEEYQDVVDGGNQRTAQQQQQQQEQQHHYYHHQEQQQHYYHNNHHYGATHHLHQTNYHQQLHHNKQTINDYHQRPHHHHQHQHQHLVNPLQLHSQDQQLSHKQPAAMEATYNNNLFYYEPSTVSPAATPLTPTDAASCFSSAATGVDIAAVNELALRVQTELRAAKSRDLACTEVSLPYDLMPRIAADIIKASEREPCGVRGCSLYIEFEDEPNNSRRIASFKVDDSTVSTFELYLTLKQDKSGWTSLLPQFLKNLTRSNTILISPDFTLTKNKLYSFDD